MRWTEDKFRRVKDLAHLGLSDYKIAAVTGVPRSTVLRWRKRIDPPHSGLTSVMSDGWKVTDVAVYCYLLGIYLGDGHLTHRPPGSWSLRVSCDRAYPEIIGEIRRAMEAPDPFGWLPGCEPLPDQAAQRPRRGVLLHPLLLQQLLGRHPADLHRSLRGARDPSDAVKSSEPDVSHRKCMAILEELVGPKT
jgi:Homeodomain-like domain